MKKMFLPVILMALLACHQPGIFYNESNFNTVTQVVGYNNQLFILGQHFVKEDSVQYTHSLLCVDTALNKVWDKPFGNYEMKERIEQFCIDKTGNIYLVGYNEKRKAGVLMKCDATGNTAWRKEYPGIKTISHLQLCQDSTLVVAGAWQFSESALVGDSCFAQKMDLQGNIVWRTNLCTDIGARLLVVEKDKILLGVNKGSDSGIFPDGRLICLSQDGHINWTVDMNEAGTALTNGVNLLKLKMYQDTIYVLCKSHNDRIGIVKLLQLNLAGTKTGDISADLSTLQTQACPGHLWMFTGLVIDKWREPKRTLLVQLDQQNQLVFCTRPQPTDFVDFTRLGNITYAIGNVANYEKHLSYWKVTRYEE